MNRRVFMVSCSASAIASVLTASPCNVQSRAATKGSLAMNMPQFYTDKVSAYPGETIAIHASGALSPVTLTVTRVAKDKLVVEKIDGIKLAYEDTPDNACVIGCDWPVAHSLKVGKDWATGYYDLHMEGPDGSSSHHFFCVKKNLSAVKAKAVIILNTNTYQAYNYWGGANAYARVAGMEFGQPTTDEDRNQAIGVLALNRPYAQGLLVPPKGFPRLVNIDNRGVGDPALPKDMNWFIENQPTPYDGSAGFIDKWEHHFAAWCEINGYEIDYLTDHDFESGEDILGGYKSVLLVGHSEYWSGPQRDGLNDYVEGGGNLAVFSGNTGYWKVRWEKDAQSLICHKWKGETDDPLWQDSAARTDATHLWSHPEFGRSEAEVTGLSFLYGGYHRLGLCAARGAGGYTIYDDKHWALENTDLYYGDVIGGNLPFLGYENDGCPIAFSPDGLPVADGGIGIPQNLEIIGLAPATLFEDETSPYPALIPPENPDTLARIAYGESTPANKKRLQRGHAVMASFKKGQGEVFNGGTTEWAHGLAAKDPFVEKITHNVLSRFGLSPS